MVRYLISAHGRMASGIKKSLEILLGQADMVEIFDAYVDCANVEDELRKRIDAVPADDCLVMMSDIPGGSVNQIMMRYLDRANTFLVTGVNLALVVGLTAAYTDSITAEQIQEVIRQSRDMMFLVELDENDAAADEDDFF